MLLILGFSPLALAADRPNILWITCEDISPDLGCYGVPYATTPNLDRFASQGVRYTNAFAPIGVCAPSRSTIITGMYACSIGTQHMRCMGRLPEGVRCFSAYVRDAGYYCTNNVKQDYNLATPRGTWDESSNKAHWRHRKPGQPFFAVFNFVSTHESQLWETNAIKYRRELPQNLLHDPSKIAIPPYHPDTPEVRRDWANYHDDITYMDRQAGDLLKELEDDGLAGDTIVFFFSDHGAGMPRSKRWLYDSSLRVPLMVRFPEKFRAWAPAAAGQTIDRLVSFVDLAPTVLSLVGAQIPSHLQGVAFLGPRAGQPRQYIHGFRDRMDERYDMIRCVRDGRYTYIRNFQPHKPYHLGQYLYYAHNMPTLRVWEAMARDNKLNEVQRLWMGPRKPVDELYDTESDPWETRNLAADPAQAGTLDRMRGELRRWMTQIKDLGLLPEADMRSRFGGRAEYDGARAGTFPVEHLLLAAELASSSKTRSGELLQLLGDSDAAVRWWGAMGLNAMGPSLASDDSAMQGLSDHLTDEAGDVRIEVAEALARCGRTEKAIPVLGQALADGSEWVRLRAANALDNLDAVALPVRNRMQAAAKERGEYVPRVMEHALPQLDAQR